MSKNADHEQKVEKRNQKHRYEAVRYLLVQGQGRTHPQKARSDTVGHGHIVVVLARVEKEEDQIIEQGIHTAEAERDVVSKETSRWCVKELCPKDENVPLERCPREQDEARGEVVKVDEEAKALKSPKCFFKS